MMPVLPRRAMPLAAACLAAPRSRAQRALPAVVASFSILGDLVRQVAGEAVALRVLAGPGTDPHLFQPRPSEADAVRGAALVVRNGLGFEPWLDRLIAAARPAGPVLTASEGIAARRDPRTGAPDPHAWQDARLAQSYVRAIAAGLAAALPDRTEAVRAGAAAALARLAALDGWVEAQLATVPAPRRILVTTHDAFGYFAARYGVRVLAAQGVSAEAQPSAAAVAALIGRIRAERITAVFLEGPGSQALMERLAADAGVAVRGRLYADTLSPPDGPAPGYEAMMRHNVGIMVQAMTG